VLYQQKVKNFLTSKNKIVSHFHYIGMANEMYQETWFGDSNENGFGSIYDNINNK